MIDIRPVRLIDLAMQAQIRREAADLCAEIAGRLNGTTDVTVRPLTATDLMVGPGPNPVTRAALASNPALTANVYTPNAFPNARLTTGQAAVIYGYLPISAGAIGPQITELRVTVGTKPVAIIDLTELYAWNEGSEGLLTEPILFQQNDNILIDMLAAASINAGTEFFRILGFIGEKAGTTIDYQSTSSARQLAPAVAA